MAIGKMNFLGDLFRKQAKILLENKWHAMFYAIVFALLPFSSLISVVIITLVTLRKGWKNGCWLLLPVLAVSLTLALTTYSFKVALISILLNYVPCYLAACVLRLTTSWRNVVSIFLLQTIICVTFLHYFMPEYILTQLQYLLTILRDLDAESSVLAFINDKSNLNQMLLASYLLGFQAVAVVFSAFIPLMMARSIQSDLFFPGEFKNEILSFRGDKFGLLLLIVMLVGANQQSVVAVSILPMLLFYFLLTGISLSLNVFSKHKPFRITLLLMATIFFLPFIMLPVYVIFGSLDSLFNFRLYLGRDAGKTI